MMNRFKFGLVLLTCSALSACSAADRMAKIGETPDMTKISNPTTQEGYQPVSLPMPTPKNTTPQRNSLWAADRTTFFKDQRAKDVGDIITVLIEIDDEAQLDNETERTRESGESAGLNNLLGMETQLDQVFPEAIDTASLVDAEADSGFKGSGTVDRKEKVEVQLAALITQILPNGNMVVHGRQEVLVNFEKRILDIDGVIRPQDISVANTISYEKIAEARIAYGGEGQLSDVQQPRYGQQLYDIVFPF
jgi:flagellar L-ring protein precursor FlgH